MLNRRAALLSSLALAGVSFTSACATDDVIATKLLISDLRTQGDLSKEYLEGRLGVPLLETRANDSWRGFEADIPSGPFRHVELRQPHALPWRLVILEARPGVAVSHSDLAGDPIPKIPATFNPHMPPDGEHYYRWDDAAPKQAIYVSFGNQDNVLRGFSVHRGID
jgi:hypothetical protein